MRRLLVSRDGDATMIGVVIAGLVAIIVGVLIWYKINSAIYGSMGYAADGTAKVGLNLTKATFTTVNASANTIWTLFPIIAIVVVAGVILAVVMGFGRAQS